MTLAIPNKKFWNWAPLFFSSFFFFPLLSNYKEITVTDVVMYLGIYALFVYFYHLALQKKGETVTLILIAMALLCSFGTAITWGTQSLFGFIAFFCGFNYRRKQSIMMVMFLFAAILISAFIFVSSNFFFFILPAIIVSSGLFVFGMLEQRERLHREQQAQNQEQIEQLGAIAERERIARDLHDLLGHSLSSIALKAELASKLTEVGASKQATEESQQVAQLARSLLSEVRQAVSGLKQVGIYAQLEILIKRLQDAGFIVEQQIDTLPLNAEQESSLCFIFKEAVTNIIRHSKGKYVQILLTANAKSKSLVASIKDDGQVKKYRAGNGVDGIKDRVASLNGTCDICTKSGMSVEIELKEFSI